MYEWSFPAVDPVILSFYRAVMQWASENAIAMLVLTNLWAWLKVLAIRSPNAIDDKIITFLTYFFSFKWMKQAAPEPLLQPLPEAKKPDPPPAPPAP